jgi:hypothetical protein
MQFTLLAPWFALGLVAIALPVLVHLVHKEKRDPVAFPSLQFIRRTPYPFRSRQKIRDWLLFLLRCAVLALAAFAFARPVFARRGSAAAPGDGGREIVVLLDRSFSMRVGDRWTRARAEATKVLTAVGPRDRATLIAFDLGAAALHDATNDQAVLRAALDSLQPSDLGTRLAPATTIAQRVLSTSERARRALVVISDFQRTSWDLQDDARMPPGTAVIPVDVSSGRVTNRGVRSVEVRRDQSGAADRVLVAARVANLGPSARGVGARLEVSGRSVATATVDLPTDGGATVLFRSVAAPPSPVAARVILDADSLGGDDAFGFLLARAPTISVLVVDHPDAVDDRRLFLQRALAIGDRPAFDVLERRSTGAAAADLVGRRLVILADAGVPPSIGAGRLVEFVRAGGGIINVLGERTSARTWPAAATSLIPGQIAPPMDRLGQHGAVLGYVDYTHPALAVFSGARSGDLSAARFFRYRAIDTTDGVLARFDDGAVALSEHHIGKGRVLTLGSSLDGVWSDLPRQAVFLPFLHQLAQYTSSYREVKRSWSAGDVVNLGDIAVESGLSSPTARWSVIAPDGRRESVASESGRAALTLRRTGVYEIRPSGQPGARAIQLAVNIAPAELDFGTFDVARLTNALLPASQTVAAPTPVDAPPPSMTETEAKQSLWWYLLALATALLLVEALVARRTSALRSEPL